MDRFRKCAFNFVWIDFGKCAFNFVWIIEILRFLTPRLLRTNYANYHIHLFENIFRDRSILSKTMKEIYNAKKYIFVFSVTIPTTNPFNTSKSDITTTVTYNEKDYETFNLVLMIVFGLITTIGIIGNLLVIITTFFKKNVSKSNAIGSTTDVLIVNLAFADLLFVVFCVPFTAIRLQLVYICKDNELNF